MSKRNKTEKVITAIGGIAVCAEQSGVTLAAVYHWIRLDVIPPSSAIKLYFYARSRPNNTVILEDVFHNVMLPEVQSAVAESTTFKDRPWGEFRERAGVAR